MLLTSAFPKNSYQPCVTPLLILCIFSFLLYRCTCQKSISPFCRYINFISRMPRHSCCEVRVMQLHDILLLRTSAILPEAISAGGLTPSWYIGYLYILVWLYIDYLYMSIKESTLLYIFNIVRANNSKKVLFCIVFWIQKLYSMWKICYNLCTHYAV